MSHETTITHPDGSRFFLPNYIREMLEVETIGEVKVSVADRTLTAEPEIPAGTVDTEHGGPKRKRIPGLNRGLIWMSGDFDAPLPDEFWLGKE